mmetsp:Transcript_1006/g.2278  ORF Transcript_1006/g.2278 Transcript_1006/m.2278 type:complete len:207 (+) Transcript_1006:461-1081(+)
MTSFSRTLLAASIPKLSCIMWMSLDSNLVRSTTWQFLWRQSKRFPVFPWTSRPASLSSMAILSALSTPAVSLTTHCMETFSQSSSIGIFLRLSCLTSMQASKGESSSSLKNTIGFWFCVPCTKKPESEEALIEKIPSIPLIPTKGSRGLRCLSCSHNDCKIGKGYKENAEGGGVNVGSGRQKSENRKAKEVVTPHPMLVNMMLQDS